MKIKNERTVAGPWHPAIEHFANLVDYVWRFHTGNHPRITGLGEEGHSKGSLHYGIPSDIRMRAIDVDADRTHVTLEQQMRIDRDLRRLAGTAYDIVWEDMDTVNAHLHGEYDLEELKA